MGQQIPLLKVEVPDGQLVTVSLDDLQENAKGASNHLKGAMRCTGQLEPILLEALPSGAYRIRDGNRRVQAARSLLWTEIEAEVFSGLTETEWALVVAGRHNRSANPVEEARLVQQLATTLTPEGISANTGLTLQSVRAAMTLLNLPNDVLDLIGTKALSLGIAERAARLKGMHAMRAIQAIRTAAAQDKSFTAKALKEITVARANALGSKLLAAAPPPPSLIPASEVLAAEVRELSVRRGVPLEDLLRDLGASTTTTTPTHPGGTAARVVLH